MDEAKDFYRRGLELLAERERLMEEARALVAEARQQAKHLRWLVSSIRRQQDPDFHTRLQDGIRLIHRCDSRHVTGFAVRKVMGQQILWEGMVEEFDLIGHSTAERCYAWHYMEHGKRKSFSILKVPPTDTPQRAVQLYLMAREANLTSSAWT